ncbi:mor transcription activator family protein [Xenorhabdus bovienii]|uniref:mor transcription activator family protein n=1 Tax=Xenorhabdus bovienii TaxID=40576 RepID=UPI0023B2EEC0|nr:mor transcription activator family protein [Xenorhabdus bovienii]MDE9466867.1 mor transcription activator family protein [Xenorhabdus bovienii]
MQIIIEHTELAQLESLLPDSALQLTDVMGYPATARLISRFGGVTLSAKTGKAAERSGGVYRLLREVLTDEECKALMGYLGDAPFYIPRCEKAFRFLRNGRFLAELAARCQEGLSRRQAMALLCPKYGFSDRIGWKLVGEQSAKDVPQPRLFD